jgi:hypothetical protein
VKETQQVFRHYLFYWPYLCSEHIKYLMEVTMSRFDVCVTRGHKCTQQQLYVSQMLSIGLSLGGWVKYSQYVGLISPEVPFDTWMVVNQWLGNLGFKDSTIIV